MSTSKQILYISILFVGLMLLSAGVGALIAGEMIIGGSLLIGGVFMAGVDGIILYALWKRNQSESQEPDEAGDKITEPETGEDTEN